MTWTDLEGLPPAVYNQQFVQKLAQDPESIRMVGDNFVRDRLREDMVFNAVIPQTPITQDRLQVALETDTMYEVIHLDPNAAASIVDFRGSGRGQIVRAPRVALGFHMLRSDDFDIYEQELLVYPYPIINLVHEYSIKAIGDQHDLYMLQNVQRSVSFVDANPLYKSAFGGGTVTGLGPNGGLIGVEAGTTNRLNPVNSGSIVRAKQALSNRIRPEVMIIPKVNHDDIDALQIFEQGDVLRSETFISGYRQPTWTGIRMVVTTKADIFRPGNIWLFAAPEFLGKNRVFEYNGSAYKLFIDRRSNVITWHVYVTVGAIIANVGSCVKLRLYDDAFETTANSSGVDAEGVTRNPGDVNPLNIRDTDLYQNRNLSELGGRFMSVRQF